MANPAHVKILKQGGNFWNMWRRKNPWVEIDLTAAKVKNANLEAVDFEKAILFED
jgi:hypothetical protein